MPFNISPAEIDEFFNAFDRVAKGMAVGNYAVLFCELEKRSCSRPTIDILIGLCGICYGRIMMDKMEFDFSDELEIACAAENKSHRISLQTWDIDQLIKEHIFAVDIDWCYSFANTYSNEYREVCSGKAFIGHPKIQNPVIIIG